MPNTCTLLKASSFSTSASSITITLNTTPLHGSRRRSSANGDWTDDDLNPLFTLLDDVTPTYCQAQLAIPSFLAQCDRIGRAMAKFSAHSDTVADPFSADLARSVLTEFGLATQWAVDNYIVVIPAPPQLQRYRFELGGLGNTPSSREYFYRSYGLRLAFHHPNASLLAQRATSPSQYFTEIERVVQSLTPGRCRAAEPVALLAAADLLLQPRANDRQASAHLRVHQRTTVPRCR